MRTKDGTFTVTLEYRQWEAIISALYRRAEWVQNQDGESAYAEELHDTRREVIDQLG